jgi:hypothetical protein
MQLLRIDRSGDAGRYWTRSLGGGYKRRRVASCGPWSYGCEGPHSREFNSITAWPGYNLLDPTDRGEHQIFGLLFVT